MDKESVMLDFSLRAAARPRLATLACALALWALAPAGLPLPAAAAAQAADNFTPEVGQDGKDVIWVPTAQTLVDKMLDLAQVTPQDRLIDLGAGDGRTVITAARRGLTAVGIEYNPDMVALARRNAANAGVSQRATFLQGDLFEADLSQADVITLFLLPTINEELRPTLLGLAPGTRVVSNTFPMGDWEPDASAEVDDDCHTYCTALLWVVPAQVEGSWRLDGRPLVLKQKYQQLSGSLGDAPISDARLNGRDITFTVNGRRYTGRVQGDAIEGSGWTARRG
ncbi:methyltransferase domain-containing protein [Orrella sp. JC864]|uniref:SAM-dependent methyltransferase n=1 Tax=Orrella sp. JC864 TaxID=3120298 RepID=UPI00300A696D